MNLRGPGFVYISMCMIGRAAVRGLLTLARLDEQSRSTSSKRRSHVSSIVFCRARDGEPVMMDTDIL